jgi:recombination protein RecT
MSNLAEYVHGMTTSFNANNEYKLVAAKELHFAIQAIEKSDYLGKVAAKNPQSLRNAILNVAAVGISLNPALAHAYLVPRDGAVKLDLSFLGMVKMATDSGSISLCKAELVCDTDEEFVWHDPFTMPTHNFDPFSTERGPGEVWSHLRGGYVVAKLPEGGLVVDRMSLEEILKVRAASPSASKAGSPWNQWPLEMIKKALIKRAAKSWPQCDRIAEAIHIDNDANPVTFDQTPEQEEPSDQRKSMMAEVNALLERKGVSEKDLCRMAGINSLYELDESRIPRLISYLQKQQDVSEGEIA